MFGSRPPGPGPKVEYWDTVKVELGKSLKAWLAGPVIGVETHHLGVTKPCRKVFTGGKLKCACQVSQIKTVWRGYVPLWDERGARCVVIIGRRYWNLVTSIRHLAPVLVTRLRRQGCPIAVETNPWTELKPNASDLRQQDLRPWLLRVWKDLELAEWVRANDPAAPLPEIPPAEFKREDAGVEKLRKLQSGNRLFETPADVADVINHHPKLNGKARA